LTHSTRNWLSGAGPADGPAEDVLAGAAGLLAFAGGFAAGCVVSEPRAQAKESKQNRQSAIEQVVRLFIDSLPPDNSDVNSGRNEIIYCLMAIAA
jgi:hypothetical protein